MISHGESVTAYEKASVACADQCKSVVLKCERGVLQGDTTVYRAKACAYSKPKCNCDFSGIIIPDGGSKTVYAKSAPMCGEACAPNTVSCSQGTLSGAVTMTNLSCNPKECKCTTAWGQKLDLNEEVFAYKAATLTCSQGISCDAASNMIKIKCTDVVNNTLTIIQGTGNIADFKKSSCAAPVCACTHLGVIWKPTDPDLKVFKWETSTPPATCGGQGNFGTVKCIQSGESFLKQGDTNTSVYKFTRCQDPPGGGNSDDDVGPGDGGGTGGGVGNDVGEGEGFRRRGRGGGSGCDVNVYPYVCYNYSFQMSFNMGGGCYLPGPDGPATPPADRKNITRRVAPNSYIPAFSKKTVACNDSCANYSGYIYCGRQGWQFLDKFPYQDCKEICP